MSKGPVVEASKACIRHRTQSCEARAKDEVGTGEQAAYGIKGAIQNRRWGGRSKPGGGTGSPSRSRVGEW